MHAHANVLYVVFLLCQYLGVLQPSSQDIPDYQSEVLMIITYTSAPQWFLSWQQQSCAWQYKATGIPVVLFINPNTQCRSKEEHNRQLRHIILLSICYAW